MLVEQRGGDAGARLIATKVSWSSLLHKIGYGLLGLGTLLFAFTAMGMIGGMSGAIAASLVKAFLALSGGGLLLIAASGVMHDGLLRRHAQDTDAASPEIDWGWVQRWEELMSRPVR